MVNQSQTKSTKVNLLFLAPQNGARARGNSSTPPPSHTRPVSQEPPKPEPPQTPNVTTNIFVDDFLTAPSATKATSREALFSFDDGPSQTAPLNPNKDFFSSMNNKNSYFDDFDTLAPQKMNGNASHANHANNANNAISVSVMWRKFSENSLV